MSNAYGRDRHRPITLLQRLAPDLAVELWRVRDVRDLPHAVRVQIAHILGHEAARRGLRDDEEPIRYGEELQDLFEALGVEG